jgi:cell division protein FtsB
VPRKPRIIGHLRRAGGPAITALVVAVFVGYALFGANGLLAYGDYQRQLVKREAELKQLRSERAELRNRVNLLDPKRANPDLVDELVRKQLNVAHPDEVILPLN